MKRTCSILFLLLCAACSKTLSEKQEAKAHARLPVSRADEITVTASAPVPLAQSIAVSNVGGPVAKRAMEADGFEEYGAIRESDFVAASEKHLSTFSIDVDRAAYSNIRRFITNGEMPPADAVRIEEMLNYFRYDYPRPSSDDPFSVTTEVATAPWAPDHRLMLVGIQGRLLEPYQSLPNHLVFLIDVSGSMADPAKLPLLKQAFHLLVDQLRAEDRVAIVVYAGAAGVVLPSTSGAEKDEIHDALEALEAGGSTAGAEGIHLAYEIAKEHFLERDRVILATDGDFNVGVSSVEELETLIESKRNDGIFLTALGFGMGNYKDNKLETLADKGNGNYAYIDDLFEARKVLVEELGGTLHTIAKDVKIQVEFDPSKVESYRLIGYENRLLADRDFDDDAKDAGELGSGHSVTALYEIVPKGSGTLATVKLRYKEPRGSTSRLISRTIADRRASEYEASDNWLLAAAVAEYGMLLRGSEHRGNSSYDSVLRLAKLAQGVDLEGYRGAFIDLVERTVPLARSARR